MRQIRYLSDSIYICLSSMLLCIFLAVALGACSEKDDVVPTQPADKVIEQCVAVVAPIGDAATKTRLERTAQWFADNFSEAQLGDTMTMRLKLEWYDEEKEDLTTLSQQLASRSQMGIWHVLPLPFREHVSLSLPLLPQVKILCVAMLWQA